MTPRTISHVVPAIHPALRPRAARHTDFARGFRVGSAVEVAQHERGPVLLGQPLQLRVRHSAQLLLLNAGRGFALRPAQAAALGVINPVWAGAATSLSSLSV